MPMRSLAALLLVAALGGCASAAPEGFLDPCFSDEDCASPELMCAQIPNQYTGMVTTERLCTTQCASSATCPELVCEDWAGTELECLESADVGGACGAGAIGELDLQVCGM